MLDLWVVCRSGEAARNGVACGYLIHSAGHLQVAVLEEDEVRHLSFAVA